MRTIRIYLAAPWSSRDLAGDWARGLRDLGYTIVSTWHDAPPEMNEPDAPTRETVYGPLSDKALQAIAVRDMSELNTADVLVLLDTGVSEGKATEFGVALTLGIPRIVVVFPGVPLTNGFYVGATRVSGFLQLQNALQKHSGDLQLDYLPVPQDFTAFPEEPSGEST